MGSNTDFEGSISLEPPLNAEQVRELNEFCEERHGGNLSHEGYPGYWCDLRFAADGTSFGWNGSEKTYDLEQWVQFIIDHFLRDWGVVANGELRARGEYGDLWTLVVEHNSASRRTATISW